MRLLIVVVKYTATVAAQSVRVALYFIKAFLLFIGPKLWLQCWEESTVEMGKQ